MLKNIVKSTKFIFFVCGAAAAVITGKIIKCKKVRDAVVNCLAYGMKVKHDAQLAMQNMKEDAEDVYFDAMSAAENEDADVAENDTEKESE